MHMLLQKQHQSKEEKAIPPEPLPVWVCLPVRINLRLQPGNRLLSSVERRLPLYLTPQEIQALETNVAHNHLSTETTLLELLKTALTKHEKMQEIIRQVHQRYSRDTNVELDIKLLGPMTWEDALIIDMA